MSDRRRASLLDQMALVAASQVFLEDDDGDDDIANGAIPEGDEEEEDDLDEFLDEDDDNDEDDEDDNEEYLQSAVDQLHGGAASASVLSQMESEEFDEFEGLDNPTPLEYQWSPRGASSSNLVAAAGGPIGADGNNSREFHISDPDLSNWSPNNSSNKNVFVSGIPLAPALGDGAKEIPLDATNPDDLRHRQSFNAARRTSYAESEGSFNSAPANVGLIPAEPPFSNQQQYQRPKSIAVPTAQGAEVSRRSSYRRPSVQVKRGSRGAQSLGSGSLSASLNDDDASNTSGSSGLLGSMRVGKRRSTRRQNMSIIHGQTKNESLDTAIASLRKQDSNNEWENVAAAAMVVAASSQGGTVKPRHIQFAVDSFVLVLLTLLNVTNMSDPKDTFTVAPVNKHGFPSGEGRSEAEKQGPYSFVLAAVKEVHYDEDDKYYTIIRSDTGTEQRADSGWMEPINDPVAIEAAARAASKTVRSTQDKPIETEDEAGFINNMVDCLLDVVSWPFDFAQQRVWPWYKQTRATAKHYITEILYGNSPFACHIRVTGINLMVFCSFVFLFLEVVNLAFLPSSVDFDVAVVGAVVWSILVLELFFEVIIRPRNYRNLMVSDKAFAPSTARHVNTFHLFFESLALLTFVPEFFCLASRMCSRRTVFSRIEASIDAVLGEDQSAGARGRFILGLTALRFFAVVRHLKQMWINNTFRPIQREGIEKLLFSQDGLFDAQDAHDNKKTDEEAEADNSTHGDSPDEKADTKLSNEEDQRLKNAATIGTALMVINSHRALILLTCIIVVVPIINAPTQKNKAAVELVQLLNANNVEAGGDCLYLQNTIDSWLRVAVEPQPSPPLNSMESTYVLWAQLLPVRCPEFQSDDGVITTCGSDLSSISPEACSVWDEMRPSNASLATPNYFAETLDLRVGGIKDITFASSGYTVSVLFNENPTVSLTNMGLFYLLLGILILGLYGLQTLRSDAIRLVLDPLQRMLKIVLRYAENPLSQEAKETRKSDGDDASGNDNDKDGDEEIGNYETEQLINAITKIADLLRKCWGVAGAGIISSNLARTKDGKTVVFNPTVPGKRVYALFGFVAINGFSDQLRALDRDVMILINDVAKVVHDEVFRWALGDSGQCNKNLGAAFLMVFRIGDFSEVHKKKKQATDVVFNMQSSKATTLRRRKGRQPRRNTRNGDGDGQLQLASLPGIQYFSDRALLGMLKSFAGIHRDRSMNVWKNDFRLSAGVRAYTVDIIYGMDAGWAVEGAVGSEYKIDATYLSPHVNMASRMMSAAKQYGVTILLSKAVEELLSRPCRKKLRHLDTVYVKGSKVKQDIFTYDARHMGVDFFLIERTPEQADLEAESYSPTIWDMDQDLRAMRQHITDDFMETFHLGVKQYLLGKWPEAIENLKKADHKMIEAVLEDGYIDYNLDELDGRIFDANTDNEDIIKIRNEIGDGACRVLISYMERRNAKPPADWDAVRALMSK